MPIREDSPVVDRQESQAAQGPAIPPDDRVHVLEAMLAHQIQLTRKADERADRAESQLRNLQTTVPPPEIIAAATRAAEGAVVFIHQNLNGTWELHNPLYVPLDTAARHLLCCERTVKRIATDHGVPISHDAGPRINIRKLVASIDQVAVGSGHSKPARKSRIKNRPH